MNDSESLAFFEAQLTFYTSAENLAHCLRELDDAFIEQGLKVALPLLRSNAQVINDTIHSTPDQCELARVWKVTVAQLKNQNCATEGRLDSRLLIKSIYLLAAVTWPRTASVPIAETLRVKHHVTMHPPEAVATWVQWSEFTGGTSTQVLESIMRGITG